jgi:protein-disulfide isomerase-like protein with CxxC motif
MRTSWEKIAQYVGTTYGQDISNELQNKQTVTFVEPVHTPAVMTRHAIREQMIRTAQANLRRAHVAQQAALQAAVTAGNDPEAGIKLAVIDNEIAQADYEAQQAIPIEMDDAEKTAYNNEWRTRVVRNDIKLREIQYQGRHWRCYRRNPTAQE